MTIHELYGRLMEERQNEHEAHMRTIAVLAAIAAGTVLPTQLRVNADAGTWSIEPVADQSAVRREEQTTD